MDQTQRGSGPAGATAVAPEGTGQQQMDIELRRLALTLTDLRSALRDLQKALDGRLQHVADTAVGEAQRKAQQMAAELLRGVARSAR